MEKLVNGNTTFPGKGPFVAAFASSNLGDVSPNTAGPRCMDTGKGLLSKHDWAFLYEFAREVHIFIRIVLSRVTGLPCDVRSSTCNGGKSLCVASGPGKNMKESTEIIGRKQYEAALALLQSDAELLKGGVAFRHSFVDMSNLTVRLASGEEIRTCPAALGFAFAAGTTDGPGESVQ